MTIDKAIEWFKNKVDDYLEPEKRRVYTMAIAALRAQQKAEKEGFCALCGYGGKYLDAPPCTTCPAHPKEAEKNVPATNADRIRSMSNEELASFLCNFRDNHGEGCSCNNCVAAEYCGTGHNGMIDWLNRPAKED